MKKEPYDLIIVGGGLVGTSLACALQATTLKIALIEAFPWSTTVYDVHQDKRIIALAYSSQCILNGIGVWKELAQQAVPIKQIHVSDQGHFGSTILSHQTVDLPALGYVISAQRLGRVLQTKLSSHIDLIAPAQLTQVHEKEGFINVHFEQESQEYTLSTRLLVAADGGQSKVRQQLNLDVTQHDYGQTAIIAQITAQRCHQYTAYERFTSTGPMALLPLQGHDSALVWTVPNSEVDHVMSLNDHLFLQALQRQFGWRLGQLLQATPRQAHRLQFIRAHAHEHPRIVLIGNAAHSIHPVAGQGLNLGLRDMATLADILIDNAQRGEDIGHSNILKFYTTHQHPDQDRTLFLTDALVQTFSNQFLPLVIARNAGLLLTDALLPLKNGLIKQMAGLNGYPSRLLRGMKTD